MAKTTLTEKEIQALKQIAKLFYSSSKTKKARVVNLAKYKAAFSDQEVMIIRFICDEYTSLEIAKKLRMSLRRIEKIRTEIFTKAKVDNVIALVKYAIKFGIYSKA